jgi:hypothetical protein
MADSGDLEFWQDVDTRLEELRLKLATLCEVYVSGGEFRLAKDAHGMGMAILSLRYDSADKMRVIKIREERKEKPSRREATFPDVVGKAIMDIKKGQVGQVRLSDTNPFADEQEENS